MDSQVGLRHKTNNNLMIYPGYIPREGVEPILMHVVCVGIVAILDEQMDDRILFANMFFNIQVPYSSLDGTRVPPKTFEHYV